MRVHVSSGNNKIGKTPNVSFPPGISCGVNSKYCRNKCYAVKFYRMYPSVQQAWGENWAVFNNDPDYYFRAIRRYILKHQPEYFRWHVAGDIYDQEYLENMKSIAYDCDCTAFLAFTKMYDLDYARLPGNLSVIMSVWEGMSILKNDLKLPLAILDSHPGRDTLSNLLKCPGECETCRACWTLKRDNRNVLLKTL